MIKVASAEPEKFSKNISGTSFLSKKMKCEYISAAEFDKGNFYALNDCGLMLMGENLSLCGTPSEDDIETILSFCQFLGVYGIESEIPDLNIGSKRTMHLMQYTGESCPVCDEIITNENIYGFSEFCCSNFMGSAFSTVYSYFARKVNKRISDIYYLVENRKIVSGALATRYGTREVYITFVSTSRPNRKKGLAAKVIQHIVASNPGRRVILMCEEELLPFYTKLGFEKYGEIYLYILREENI